MREELRDEGEEAFIKAAEEKAKAKALRMCKANPINPETEQKHEADKNKPLSRTKEAEGISPALTHMIQRGSNIPRKAKDAENIVSAGERKDKVVESQSEDDELSELPNPVSCVSLPDEDISIAD